MNLYASAEANSRKTWLYLFLFFLFVIAMGWAASWFLQSSVILWIAVGLSIAMSFGSYWYSDKMVLALSRAVPVKKQEYPEVYRTLENLSITAGLPMPRLYVMKDEQPNAFATGRDAKHAVVAVTTGLLERLERAELEGVLAHELSHIGNKDMLLSTIVVVMVGIVVLIADLFFRFTLFGGMRRNDRGGQAQVFLMIIAVAFLIIAPLAAQIMKLAISRKREFLADASGALLTRYPDGLARALEKIAADPRQLKAANDATAHLFLVNPFRGKEGTSWLHKLFLTHPPIQERANALRGMRAPSA
jgi:heat shock protein HtpX